ncbi:hypothetical protein SAMN05518672_10438 [Chitinophaga sp. CF118]|uniref:lipid A deacylase LpxR family protein n=1 Tax=Chitinophaga sp. CF118 TaxID=1884367 RepID=UPI0008EF739F|nr:lipid A deacylase LpxR family protein [Chitinophaga sp. CF118]SFD98483.1 hypothetical protein SAMN05518672_10438 [Chitinophaga sp. CF118]
MGKFKYLLLISLLVWQAGMTQKKNELQVLKISEDDDYLNLRGEGTDRGYSGGLKIEFYYTKNVKPRFLGNLLMRITDKADNLYGWGLTMNTYTPTDITKTEIQYGDRPYAGVTYVSHILISSDPLKKQKLTTSISLGVIGEYSGNKAVQIWFHNLINYRKPQGWNNQIKNDIILNYFINYERGLFSPTPNLEILGSIQANAGTLANNMGLGIQFRAGLFNNYFTKYERPTFKDKTSGDGSTRRFQFYFYMKTTGTAVMDDASLQGGFFSHNSSPYVIKKDSISRFYMQYEYGIVLANRRLGIAFSEKLRTPDFKGTYNQQVGNVTFYIGL